MNDVAHYVQSSLHYLPNNRDDFRKVAIPLMLSVTPFPKSVSDQPPLLPLFYTNTLKCYYCHGLANIYCRNDEIHNKWICPLCTRPNYKLEEKKMKLFEPQFQNSTFDSMNPSKSEKKETKFQINRSPDVYFIIFELSLSTFRSGIYKSLITQVREYFSKVKRGYISILVYNNAIHLPMISKKNFRVITIPDIDDVTLPSVKHFFINLKQKKNEFNQYMDYLETLQPQEVTIPLLDIMNICEPFCKRACLTPIIVLSESFIDNKEKFQEFGIKLTKEVFKMDLFCIEGAKLVDFSNLSEFSMITNSVFRIFTEQQPEIIANEILHQITTPRYIDCMIIARYPPEIKIIDIKGSGIRTNNENFKLTSLSEDDTIYYIFNYEARELNMKAHQYVCFQFDVQYYDTIDNRIVRSITFPIPIVGDIPVDRPFINFDLLIAGCAMEAINYGRENNDPKATIYIIQQYQKNFFKDRLPIYSISRHDLYEQNKLIQALRVGYLLAAPVLSSLVYGRIPIDISLLLSPIVYSIDLLGGNYYGPFLISRTLPKEKEAFYIKYNSRMAALLINNIGENQLWYDALRSEILAPVIQAICTESYIQIIAPNMSENLYSYKHIMAIRNTAT